MMIDEIIAEMKQYASPQQAEYLSHYLKTDQKNPDEFIGLTVPQIRKITKKYAKQCDVDCLNQMLKNRYHDVRLAALLIMIGLFERGTPQQRCQLYKLYMDNLLHINNWDLVDLSAAKIVGAYVFPNTEVLWKLAKHNDLWHQRIAMLASHYFIGQNDYQPALKLARQFMGSQYDLMHKASGWMLREVGKKDLGELCRFLDENSANMPRTMLRYAVEKLAPEKQKQYLNNKNLKW